MHYKKIISGIILTGLCWTLSHPLASQSPLVRTYEAFQPTEAYLNAMDQIAEVKGNRSDGIAALIALADQNPGTSLAAHSLFSAVAFCESRATAVPLYQRIVHDFPNSGFELTAKFGLACVQNTEFEPFYANSQQLLASYGAPTVAEIVANPGQALIKYRSLPIDYQHGLINPYVQLSRGLGASNIRRFQESMVLALFGQEAFGDQPGVIISLNNRIRGCRIAMSDTLDLTKIFVTARPKVNIRSPRGNVGTRPLVKFETLIRNSASNSLSLVDCKFKLDGVDVTAQVHTVNFRINATAKKHQIFEQRLFEFRPNFDLSEGKHTFSGFLVTGRPTDVTDPGNLSFEIPIKVKIHEHDCDDDKDNEHWEDND